MGQLPRTATDGGARVGKLGNGTYTVTASAPGYGAAAQRVTLSDGPAPTVEIRLESGAGSLVGRVTDAESGAALAGARVSLGQWTALSDAAGRYRLDGIPPGAYTAQITMDGYGASDLSATIDPGRGSMLDAMLSPAPGLLRVRVVDAATGRPIEGATVGYESYELPAQAEQPCADSGLLVPLKRSAEYRAIRSRVADPHHVDSWQENGVHFFVFQLRPDNGTVLSTAEWPVVVFTMRPESKEPLSAVVITPDLAEGQAEIVDLRDSSASRSTSIFAASSESR